MQDDFMPVADWRQLPHIGVSRQRAHQWLKAGRLGSVRPVGPNRSPLIHRDTPKPDPRPAGRPRKARA